MEKRIECKFCGKWVNCFSRQCPVCDEPLYLSLDDANAKPETFLDLMTSLYNLIADGNNEERERYISSLSEQAILRRCDLELQCLQSILPGKYSEEECPDEVLDLLKMSLTSALAGYAFRSIEEFVAGKRCRELTYAEKEYIFASLDRADINKKLSYGDEIDGRILFCLALRLDGAYIKYSLINYNEKNDLSGSIIKQCVEETILFYKAALRTLWPAANIDEFINFHRKNIEAKVEKEFTFGYLVRLSESLNPFGMLSSSGEKPCHVSGWIM
jgi:hypothetical protein